MKKLIATIQLGAVFLLFSTGPSKKLIGIMESNTKPIGVESFKIVNSTGGAAPSLDAVMASIVLAGTKNISVKGNKVKRKRKKKTIVVTESLEEIEEDAGLDTE